MNIYPMSAIINYPTNNTTIRTAVSSFFTYPTDYHITYGNISTWDLSGCTDLSFIFHGQPNFNSDISKWNVSKVTNMHGMFFQCTNFNADISQWNVSSVTNMTEMFYQCRSFNKDISQWNVSNVTNMHAMFYGHVNFNADISQWNVSNATRTSEMFRGCSNFNADLKKWNVSNVTNMSSMFAECPKFTADLSKWNVSDVSGSGNIESMFQGATLFNADLRDWNVKRISQPASFNASAPNLTLVPRWGNTWPDISASLTSITFDSSVSSLSPTFETGHSYYTATSILSSRSNQVITVTLRPTAYDSTAVITVNGVAVTSGNSITVTFNNNGILNVNDILIALSKSGVTHSYSITLTTVIPQHFSAVNNEVSTRIQRLRINMDNTPLDSPIVQFVQDISNNSSGFISNAVNQRFIFGSYLHSSNPLELTSTMNWTGTTVSSSVKANSFLAFSDIRLKQNVETLTEAQGVDNIRVVQYNNKGDNSKHFGVIANELSEIYSELVHSSGENNMLSVSYLELIPICINEIQRMKKKHVDLQSQMELLNDYVVIVILLSFLFSFL